jgi:hypothetical protein
VNGSLRFLCRLALQHIDRTWLGSKYQSLSTWYVLSGAADGGRDCVLMRLLNTVVFGAIDGCNNNRCDSDVSRFDIFCISPGLVSLSPIPSQIFLTLTIL